MQVIALFKNKYLQRGLSNKSIQRVLCKSEVVFYGYKLHAVCTSTGVFINFELRQAAVHDIHYLKNIKQELSSCTVIGDKDYLSAEYQLYLLISSNIRLEIPMRENQHKYKKKSYMLRKTRKRIETVFSQLCDQFMICRNYAKSFDEYKNRILSKMTSLTMIQIINLEHLFINELPIIKLLFTVK